MAHCADVEAVKRLKARCARLLDTADRVGRGRLSTDDARVVIDGVERGPDELVEVTRTALAGGTSGHRMSLPEIEVTGEDTATGIWAMEDRLYFADGTGLHGWGHYHDTYRRTGADRRVSGSVLTRLRVEHPTAA
ncbi:nuclear transport factor 2 family protein [Streptomyces sp. NPDC047002]|uniref:nuclear transport factor 2 family protein n=1 Tax=Streptomyces sp. NPDC047002 TaxID=3155475 RepID=UPI00345233F0